MKIAFVTFDHRSALTLTHRPMIDASTAEEEEVEAMGWG